MYTYTLDAMEQCQNAEFLVTLRDCCTTQIKNVCHVIDVHVFKKIDIRHPTLFHLPRYTFFFIRFSLSRSFVRFALDFISTHFVSLSRCVFTYT